MADINDKYVLHYAVRGYASGETVTVNIYDSVGTKEVNAGTMTELYSGAGIYYYNWFPRKRTTYVAVMNCAAKPRQQHVIIRIEKTKLAGAITIPKVRQHFTDKVRDDIFSRFAKLSTNQVESNEKISDVSSSMLDFKQDIEKSFVEFKEATTTSLTENKRDISLLTNNSLNKLSLNNKGFNTLFTKSIERNFNKDIAELKGMFLKESNKFTSKELFSKLETLSENLLKIASLTDESIATSNLSNQLFNSNFKKKLEVLSQGVDDLVLLFKNGSSKSSDGSPGKEETLQICPSRTYPG